MDTAAPFATSHDGDGSPRHALTPALAAPSLFRSAPLTKAVLFSVVTLTVAAPILGYEILNPARRSLLSLLDFNFLSNPLSSIVFSTATECFLGAVAIFHLRTLERLIGSRKFAACLLSNLVMGLGFETLGAKVLQLVAPSISLYTSPGPHLFIFCSFTVYQHMVPHYSKFRLLGADFSHKFVFYGAVAQLVVTKWPQGLLSYTAGLLTGVVYLTNIAGIQRWRVPRAIIDPILDILDSSTDQAIDSTTRGSVSTQQRRQQPRQQPQPPRPSSVSPQTPLTPPTPATAAEIAEMVELITSMGFQAEEAERALRDTQYDVERAVNQLLSLPSSSSSSSSSSPE